MSADNIVRLQRPDRSGGLVDDLTGSLTECGLRPGDPPYRTMVALGQVGEASVAAADRIEAAVKRLARAQLRGAVDAVPRRYVVIGGPVLAVACLTIGFVVGWLYGHVPWACLR